MQLVLAPLRTALRVRVAPAMTRAYSPSPWTGPKATESEADVRADDHNKIKGKPGAKLQQETIKQIKREEKSDDKKAKGKK